MSLSELRAASREGGGDPQAPADEPKPNLYCLEPGHAGQLVDRSRFFYADPEAPGAPICPVCSSKAGKEKRVSATPIDPETQDFPEGFRDLAGRLQQEID